jgi:hypothetical protein
MMRRIELASLLPSSELSNKSRSDVLQELVPGVTSNNPDSSIAGTAASLSGLLQQPAKDITEQITELSRQTNSLNTTQIAQVGATQDNTRAVTTNTTTKSGGSSVAGTVGNIASGLLGGALSFAPIISGLIGLFGGGDSKPAATSTPFALPPSVQSQAGLTGGSSGQIVPVDYGQNGQVRGQPASSAPQINIQVNAMDSQSFLDHSDEIAKAVREAMLSSHSLNDVIADL